MDSSKTQASITDETVKPVKSVESKKTPLLDSSKTQASITDKTVKPVKSAESKKLYYRNPAENRQGLKVIQQMQWNRQH